jgi:protein ImuB
VAEAIARSCSPRVALQGADTVVFDVDGLSRVCGPPSVIALEVTRMAGEHGLTARVAVSDTMTAAWILAHACQGISVACGLSMRTRLAELPISWLATVFDLDVALEASHAEGARSGTAGTAGTSGTALKPDGRPHFRQLRRECQDRLATLERWGIRTCGALAALARADIHARMGPVGVRLHQAASGEDIAPLVPAPEPEVFADRVELEWPIEGLEPLTFVLARQCERLSARLEQADRGAVAIHTTLTLVTRETHVRTLALPAPLRDARVLRTLIGLDLESHPPGAAIDMVELRLDVAPGRILQGSLLTWAVPTPEDLSTLLARLGALVGETRVGAPRCLDTHDLRQVALVPFRVPEAPGHRVSSPIADTRCLPLRRFRLPVAARVDVEQGAPVAVWPSARDLAGGRVVTSAGPWRSSGSWWTEDRATWDRDEWDVELPTGVLYRLARTRPAGRWEIEGVFD